MEINKGILKQVPVEELQEGDKIIKNGYIGEVIAFHHELGVNVGGSWSDVSELNKIVVEYTNFTEEAIMFDEPTFLQVDVVDSQWGYILKNKLLGKEVEYQAFTLYRSPENLVIILAEIIEKDEYGFTKEEKEAIKRFQRGEKYSVSTFIDEDTILAGYGELVYDFEYPLPMVYIKQIYGTTSWNEYLKIKKS